MDPMGEEQLDYGDEEYGGGQKTNSQDGRGAIPALADDDMMPDDDDDDYDDLYNDVNVGEGFMQTMQQPKLEPPSPPPFSNGGLPSQKSDGLSNPAVPAAGVVDPRSDADQKPTVGFVPTVKQEGVTLPHEAQRSMVFQGVPNAPLQPKMEMSQEVQRSTGFQGAPFAPVQPKMEMDHKFPNPPDDRNVHVGGGAAPPMPPNQTGPVANRPMITEGSRQGACFTDNNGPTMLFVGELQWWTTDAEIESAAMQYGRVKEIKFFDERASGKSKGYCQLEFYDPASAAACKEGLNGFVFNGRPCVVTYASAQTLRQMSASYTNKNQSQSQPQPPPQQQQQQGRRPMNDGGGRGGMNYQGGDGGRNYGRGGWGGRGGQGFNNRGPGGSGPMRGRGSQGGKGMIGAAGGTGNGNQPYGQGLGGPGFGGPAGAMMHPQNMMGAAFDPTYMGRGGPYGGFSAPFPGMMPSYQAVNHVGLPGVAPHVNPAFFGRGMSPNGMGLLGSSGMEGQSAGMWGDTSMAGWAGDENERRTRESSYGGDDGASDYGYGEVNHERGRSNASREKDKVSEREWPSNSDRRYRDEKDRDWDRSERERHREDKDGYRDHRQRDRDRDWDSGDNYDRGQSSSRSRSKMQEEDLRSHSRDADYVKRRRLPSE